MTLTFFSIFTILKEYFSPFPDFLNPPVGGEPCVRSLPSLLAALIIMAQARKAQGPIDFVMILSFFFFTMRAFLGGLTWSKTLEKLHTHWNLRPLGRRTGWDPGVAQRLYGASWNTIRTVCALGDQWLLFQ